MNNIFLLWGFFVICGFLMVAVCGCVPKPFIGDTLGIEGMPDEEFASLNRKVFGVSEIGAREYVVENPEDKEKLIVVLGEIDTYARKETITVAEIVKLFGDIKTDPQYRGAKVALEIAILLFFDNFDISTERIVSPRERQLLLSLITGAKEGAINA